MDNPRPEKIAVVDEVRERLEGATGSVVTEYRGLTVTEMAELRRALRAAGGDYKVFKNTLVRRAIAGGAHAPLEDFLTGPTAIAFVHGDVSAVAKALRDFSRANTNLVVKGGLFEGAVLSPAQLGELANLPPRDVLLAQLAGALQAPLAQLAGLLQALPRDLAFGLSALVEERGGAPGTETAAEPAAEPAPDGSAETAAEPAAEPAPDGSAETAAEPAAEPAPDGSAEPTE